MMDRKGLFRFQLDCLKEDVLFAIPVSILIVTRRYSMIPVAVRLEETVIVIVFYY